jgi:hypothetical protein
MTREPHEQALETGAPPASAAEAVLVLGMHRGGTSAVAGLLQHSGFDLGHALMEPAAGINDKGFFESLDALQIHERFLASLGRSRFDPREMPHGWREHPAYRVAVDEVADLVRREFAASPRWAIKDPRLCRIAPVWIDALASLGIAPRAILVVRHPAEVARSMFAQRWVASSARAHLCWLEHMLEAEQATRAIRRSLVTYDALLADWRGERGRIGTELGIEWPTLNADAATAIDAFIDARERRFDENANGDAATGVPPIAMDLFGICRRRGESAWDEIAALGDTFAQGAAAFAPCLDEAIVEASLAFIEAGQGRDIASRVALQPDWDRLSHEVASLAESQTALARGLGERDAQAQRSNEALHASISALSALIERFAEK